MPASIDKLLKMLLLEGKQYGFSNKAVIGGFQKYIPAWNLDASAEKLPEIVIREITDSFKNYETGSNQQRYQSILDLIKKLGELYPKDAGIAQAAKNIALYEPQPVAEQQPAKEPEASQSLTGSPKFKLNASLTILPGVGEKISNKYLSAGVKTLGDLLYYFPRRYDDYSQLKPINRIQYGDVLTIIATVQSVSSLPMRNRNMSRVEVVVSDGTGFLRLVFFRGGSDTARYLENRFKHGDQFVISGKVDMYLGRLQMTNPDFEPLERVHLSTNGIIPVYPLTGGLTQNEVRKDIHEVINLYANKISDFMPAEVKKAAVLIDLPVALHQIHYPSNQDLLTSARERLAFDEIFLLQLGVLQQKQNWQSGKAKKYTLSEESLASLLAHIPFELTNAQKKVLAEITEDLNSGHPMNRLLQGDVGSGKTIIAALGACIVASSGAQSAIMAPTSILAEQHYQSLLKLTQSFDETAPLHPQEIRLLTGDTSPADREEIRSGLEDGSVKLLIGTHALIEEPVKFKNLQYVVIDEQHRFGVTQRASLRQKGQTPHLMVMTATPIPRSLALTLYGDLDLSIMDEMPVGRIPVETHVLPPLERERAYQMIQSQVDQGNQAFIVYPLIENNENNEEIKAAVDEHELLQRDVFPKDKLGLLHGRMKADEKEDVMKRFRNREFQILVSTTVIEVGVDVPNATIILIEGANRFGLAQLHQLRGRVGRGTEKAYCLLVPDNEDSVENERLMVMTQTNDGFVLAEKDLQQRGPGDFIGYRQSGYADLKLASLMDLRTLEKARNLAQELFKKDETLSLPENAMLKEKLAEFWQTKNSDLS